MLGRVSSVIGSGAGGFLRWWWPEAGRKWGESRTDRRGLGGAVFGCFLLLRGGAILLRWSWVRWACHSHVVKETLLLWSAERYGIG